MLRHLVSNEIFTVLLVIGLIIVAIAKLTAPKRFDDFILVLGNDKYLKIYSRDQKFFDKFDALLFTNLIISVSVFCFISYKQLTDTQTISANTMFKLTFSIGVFILIKVLLERLIGSLLEIDKLIDQYIFQKISFKNYLGLLLLPINALLLYTFTPTLTVIYVIVSIMLIVNIIGLISSFKTHQSLIKNNLFYFILYLCALEIAPYIILYKVFISN
ncbi:DUF4271 domain-containing protein [Algibacter amylolyticus]|uniref:DUF4271 domain-containing protein n=1 Tax=Algibacter amylolyticus TaxID=1608400 RepID=A0A5M7BG62_9FLAO|nr:DUF4271 domain-containing protein [Algibacter amylolyticus]KAA5827913.1 DUF4271 domain-containing protein [Algibacter amylolyticus]MBB5267146.1 hypothetical protein [Algibacter amylolyticus]TSJ82158.1 DUF4271 domain-containing protein [Algibacter amylolyticus]